MNFLKKLINDYNSKEGRIFAIFIQILIIISIIDFSIETIPGLDKESIFILNLFENFIAIIFTVEYILRIILSEKKLKFIFSFYGIIDLLAILPFYLSTGLDLRSIRILRLLRLFRILKILRYNNAIENLKRSFLNIKEELIICSIISSMVIYLSAVGIYYFENEEQPEVFSSVFHSLWWAVATLTTVGYGDIYPVTPGGKFFTFLVLLIGIALVSIPAGLFASALINGTKKEELKGE